jgi:O-antigen/teichoic acid export membrane protein
MSTAEKVAIGSIGVGLGEVIEKGSMFLRNLVLARMLTPADFGLGSTFVTTYLLFLMISSFSTNQYIVQSDSGDDKPLQNSVHTVELVRGIFSSLAIYFSAGWIASLFGVPESRWAFQALALIPLMLGLVHTDIYRYQRKMRFSPNIFTAVMSDLASLAAAYPAALYFGDYTACLVCLLIKIVTYLILSHLLAERAFRLGFSPVHLKSLWFFGWPLLLNGSLIFLTLQGDKMVVGSGKQLFGSSVFTLADLGAFSVAFSFTWIPTLMGIKVISKVILPYLAQVKNNPGNLSLRLLSFFPFVGIYSVGISVVFILGGGIIISVFCGEEYLVDNYLIIWLAAANSVRVFRGLTGLSLLAIGDTKNYLNCNIIRGTAFIATLIVSSTGLYLDWIGFSIFMAELLSLVFSIFVISTKHKVSVKGSFPYLGLVAVLVPLLILVNHFLNPYDGMVITRILISMAVMGAVSFGILLMTGETYRKNLMQLFRNIRNDSKI